MSDTDKQALADLYEILIVKNLQGSSNLLDVNMLAFKICKLISLEYFELLNRSVLVASA